MKYPALDELLAIFNGMIAAEGVTTSDGDAGGVSFVDSGLIDYGAGSFVGMMAVIYIGDPDLIDSSGISAFDNATGEVSLSNAYKTGAVIPAGVSYKIITFRFVSDEVDAIELKLDDMLKLTRSDQSGNKTLTNAYVAEYDDSDTAPWLFMGAWIDLTNMAGGDTVWIRLSSKGVDGGAYVVEDETSYTGAQPAGAKAIRIGSLPNVYGVKIEAYQSAGTPPYLSLPMEFFCAKRIG